MQVAAGHVGIEVLNEYGKEREFHASPQGVESEFEFACPLAKAFPYREWQGGTHCKEETWEYHIHPGESREIRVEGMVGWWHLGVIHPARQYAIDDCCAQHHCENGVSA